MGCLVGRETTQGKNLTQIKTFLYKSFLYWFFYCYTSGGKEEVIQSLVFWVSGISEVKSQDFYEIQVKSLSSFFS